MAGVIESIPYPIGTSLDGTLRKDLGNVWGVSLNGVGFLLSTMDQSSPFEFRSYGVHSLPPLKARIDTSSEPGEQLLEAWWPRAQHSWHEGLGQEVFDSEDSSRFRVHRARNLDMLSEEGKVKLGKKLEIFQTNTVTESGDIFQYGQRFALADNVKDWPDNWWDRMFMVRLRDFIQVTAFPDEIHDGWSLYDGQGHRVYANPTPIGTTAAGDDIKSGAFNWYELEREWNFGVNFAVIVGNYMWYGNNDLGSGGSIKRDDFTAGTVADTIVSNLSWTLQRVYYLKGRVLFFTDAGEIYEAPPYTGTALDASVDTFDPLFTAGNTTSWVWSNATEAGPAILVSGFDEVESVIYSISLTAQDLQFTTEGSLGVPSVAWRAPEGEKVYSLEAFSGDGVMIGTSEGLRIGSVQSDGSIQVTPVIVEMEYPCYVVKAVGKYGYFGWRECVPGYSGVGRIDLGDLNYDVPWAVAQGGGDVSEIVPFEGHMFFGITYPDLNATSQMYQAITKGIKDADEYAEDGYFETGEIRFSTFETKDLRFMDWLMKEDVAFDDQGTLEVAVKRDLETTFTDRFTGYKAGEFAERFPSLYTGTRFNLRVTLKSGIATSTPELLEWRLRAEPRQIQNRFRERIPVMVYDFIERLDGVEDGREGLASERLQLLKKWYREETEILYQGPDYYLTGEYRRMRVEDLQFQTYTPPARARGFGGIALIVLREVA